jgi:hypothetical protein
MQPLELVRVMQWEAPGRVLGAVSAAPVIARDALIACSEGNVGDWLDILERGLDHLRHSEGSVQLQPVQAGDVVVALYLDVGSFPSWNVIVRRGTQLGFYHEPGLVTIVDGLAA